MKKLASLPTENLKEIVDNGFNTVDVYMGNQTELKKDLLRIVIDQNSKAIVLDPLRNKNGQGAYSMFKY